MRIKKQNMLSKTLIILSLLNLFTFGQEFKVTKISGNIKINGNEIKLYDVININDPLERSSTTDYIIVINTNEGTQYKIPSQNPDINSNNEELIVLVKDYISPGKKDAGVKGREEIEDEFESNYYLINECRIKFNRKKYILDFNSAFYLKSQNPKDSISIRLPILNDSIIILNRTNNNLKDTSLISLQYIDGDRINIFKNFKLILVNKNEYKKINEEVSKFHTAIKDLELKETTIRELTKKFISFSIGKFNEFDIDEYLKNEFDL